MRVDAQQPPALEALKARESAAQEQFWLLYWERIHTVCARILGDGADASDVATDVIHDFLFKYVDNVSQERAVWSYMKLMATRRSLRRRKGMDRHKELVSEAVPADNPRPADNAANTAMLRPRLADCLEELTPKAQQVLKLRFGGELTNQRIGELVGGSKQYIGRLIRQSTDKLRECLERKAA